jgi:hypothetical protein
VAVMRSLAFLNQPSISSNRVVEPEIDMRRPQPRASSTMRMIALMRWLMPLGRIVIGPPRRAVEREMEEVWPSSDR